MKTVPLVGSMMLTVGGALIVMRKVCGTEVSTPPFFALLPFDYPGPLIRVCRTDYGICLIPYTIQPGTPCQCRAAGGTWLPGVSIH